MDTRLERANEEQRVQLRDFKLEALRDRILDHLVVALLRVESFLEQAGCVHDVDVEVDHFLAVLVFHREAVQAWMLRNREQGDLVNKLEGLLEYTQRC